MKNKIINTISTIMMLVPWSILLIRRNDWALQSPAAEIIIGSYIAFMIFSGVFTTLNYTKGRVKNTWMQVCLVVNNIYAFAGVFIGGWMIYSSVL